MSCHPAKVFYNLEAYLNNHIGDPKEVPNWSKKTYDQLVKFWTVRWNRATKNEHSLPLVTQCPLCSGKEMERLRKAGVWKESTKDERRLNKEFENDLYDD